MSAPVESQREALAEHNELVPLLLGARARLAGIESLLDTPLPDGVTSNAPAAHADPALWIALGALSLQRQITRWLRVAADTAPDAADEKRPADDRPASGRELLR